MRKIAFPAIALILMATFTACEKNYTCTCVYPGSSVGTTETSFKAKQDDAEAKCAALNTAAQTTGGSCAL